MIPSKADATIGFVGLGNIGRPIANRIASSDLSMIVFDVLETNRRAPPTATVAPSLASLLSSSTVVFLCLPSLEAELDVIAQVPSASPRPDLIVDTSTIGPSGAERIASELAMQGISYIDAPVSGGVARAHTGDLTTMIACSAELHARVCPLILTYSSKIVAVGFSPGQAQAMKLVNNYASIACMLSTSEAISYGLRHGLELMTMLDVINTSSGQSFVSSTLFPKHIATGTFDSAAPARIVGKDLALFVGEAMRAGTSHSMAAEALALFERYRPSDMDEDWLHIFEFIRDRGRR